MTQRLAMYVHIPVIVALRGFEECKFKVLCNCHKLKIL